MIDSFLEVLKLRLGTIWPTFASRRVAEPLLATLSTAQQHVLSRIYRNNLTPPVIIEFRGQIVVQVAGFPGYENRSYYGMEHIPSEWQDRIDYWCRQKSQVSPPFVPGPGPYFSIKRMSTQDLSTVNATIYFRDDNEKAREFFIALSDYIINEGVELQDIPQWVSDDNRVTRHLGL